MKFKDKLKSLTIDNVIALVVGFAMYLGSAFAMANNFMPNTFRLQGRSITKTQRQELDRS